MPKTRRSNTVASTNGAGRNSRRSSDLGGTGGGVSSGGGGNGEIAIDQEEQEEIEENEIADRLQNRLEGVRSIRVSSPSRTRRRQEDVVVTFNSLSPGRATVESESGSTYHVDYNHGTCDCIHSRTRGNGCRHIDAVNNAIGQIVEERNSGTLGSSSEGDVEDPINFRQAIDAQDEEERRNITINQEDDNFFYSDHPEEFRNRLLGLADGDLPYEYGNVLNGSQITFGLEIEFVDGNADQIARELYELGINAYDSRVSYHSPGIEGKWRLERDGSVSDGSSGGEIVSPVLKDTPETWRTIEKICEVAKRHGARIDSRCGAHVHLGMDPLDTARQRWKRFFKTISSYEECIYRFSGGDLGRIRSGHEDYAMPFNNRADDAYHSRFTMDTVEDVQILASRVSNRDRYYGVNLTNIPYDSKPNTVEFRYFNGSINPKQIQANVKLANGIIMASEKARAKGDTSEPMLRRGEILKNGTTFNQRNDTSIMNFIDVVFSRKKDKDFALEVFAKNSWR